VFSPGSRSGTRIGTVSAAASGKQTRKPWKAVFRIRIHFYTDPDPAF
jgi:hypothetical protein